MSIAAFNRPSGVAAATAPCAGGAAHGGGVAGPLAAHLRPHLVWAAGFSLVINLLLLVPSAFMLQVYDRVLVTRSVETLSMLVALATLALVAFGVLDAVRARLLAVLGASLERRFGPSLLERLMADQARQVPGVYVEGLQDLATLRSFLGGPGVVALFDAPWAPVYLLLITAFDVRLGLLAGGAALALLALAVIHARQVRAAMQSWQMQARASQRLAERCVANAEVVTALGMGAALTRRWARLTVAQQEQLLAAGARGGWLGATSRALRQWVQVAMLALGAWLVIRDGATPGVMIATTIILGRALAPVEQLVGGWQALAEARLAAERLGTWLRQAEQRRPALPLPRPLGHLVAEQLSYLAAPQGPALLRGVSLSAAPGSVLAIVGSSGAGKTTLARLLVGVLRPSGGVVRLDGADLRHHAPQALGAAVGYLPQDVELFAGTVAENIARFTDAPAEAVIAAARQAGAHALIQQLPQGYDTPVGDSGRRLSGGQRQRVALARAVFGQPSLVVLDEPDASLDAAGEDALVGAIQALKAEGSTVVVITQRRRLLAVADQVLVLNQGQVERAVSRNGAAGDVAHSPPAPAATPWAQGATP